MSKGKREEITVLTFSTPLESAGHRSDVDIVAGGDKVGYFRVDVIAWLYVEYAWNVHISVSAICVTQWALQVALPSNRKDSRNISLLIVALERARLEKI